MAISVVDPVSPAIERTKQILFRPFDIGKWFVLGFCAFLAQLGEGGGGVNFPNTSGGQGGGGQGGDEAFKEMAQWLQDNLAFVLGIALVGLVVIIAISAVLQWLGARGKFMFIDGIVHNRGAVVAPWNEYRREGNSLFFIRFVIGIITFLLFVVLVAGGILLALPDIRDGKFGIGAVLALAVGIPLLLLIGLASSVIQLIISDFVAPIMYLRRLTALEAWNVCRQDVLAGRIGTFVLYFLFKIVLGFAIGIMAIIGFCLSCCLAAIPYLGTVILLPLFVFSQAYPLYFLEQFGPEWRFFSTPRTEPHDDFEDEQDEGPEDRPADERYERE
jgi:hypothetical protein